MRSGATQLGSCHALPGRKTLYPELDILQGLEDYRCWTVPRTSEIVSNGPEIIGLVLKRLRTCTRGLNEAVHLLLSGHVPLQIADLGQDQSDQ